MTFKADDKVICKETWVIYSVKYILTNKIIVNNGEYDFPFFESDVILLTPLMEELL